MIKPSKTKPVIDENWKGEKRRNIKQIKTSIIKMEHYQVFKLLNDSSVSNFATRKWTKVNDLSSGQYPVHKDRRFKT